MSLESKLMQDLKTAMKAKDQAALRSIRAVKAALLLQKTDGTGEAMTEDKEIKLLQKLVKQRKDSLEIFEKQSREDLAEKEREEIAVIEKYLPAQMSREELEEVIKGIIAQTGASSMRDMGKVMGRLPNNCRKSRWKNNFWSCQTIVGLIFLGFQQQGIFKMPCC